MANNNAQQFKLAAHNYLILKSQTPNIVGRIAVNFYKASFKNQGMKVGGRVKKWDARGPGPRRRYGRKLLIDTARLSKGITMTVQSNRVLIGVDPFVSKYAALHNDGGDIPITLKMRKFFWAMYYQSGGKVTYNIKNRKVARGQKNRDANADADFWKAMALTKKTHITIKARPFIYESDDLVKEITKDLIKRINKIVNKK